MYTFPKIFNSKSLAKRTYIEFYFDNERVREYSGKSLGLKIFPGKAKTLTQRTALLKLLFTELLKALENGTYRRTPEPAPETKTVVSAESALNDALDVKLNSTLSRTYKRDLKYIHGQFLSFLTDEEKHQGLEQISYYRIAQFLQQFTSSNTYYMHKRTDLSVLFSTAGKVLNLELPVVQKTDRRKPQPKRNKAYSKEQIMPLLNYLEKSHPTLYICCMLTYAAWLRPHLEIRELTRGHFSQDFSIITLEAEENKGRRLRVVYVPEYAREPLKRILDGMPAEQNLFSGKVGGVVNPDYFKTAWTRIKPELRTRKLISTHQTIYSFRHAAALRHYQRFKDITKLQARMGHRSAEVTKNYLRDLGVVDIQELKDSAPELD